jgi:putative beta-lysine N-acetyltransferase
MRDRIETIGNRSIVQHGKLNNRIYLMKMDDSDCPVILDHLKELAQEHAYAKIICKVPEWAVPLFMADGFMTEAIIPEFYQGKTAVFFLSKYRDSDRLMNLEYKNFEELSELFKALPVKESTSGNDKYDIRLLDETNVEQITDLYKKVFKSYPFPIFNPGYILKSMKENVCYFGIQKKNNLIAVASSELDRNEQNAEMTDFATDPDFRGKKLGQRLLSRMEKEMMKMNIKTVYTIARLPSIPMNKVFLKHQYQFAGTLLRNTNISGSIESMNVYYKLLK